MKENSVFWIASQSKPITDSAFMMLVDEQKLSLDDSVAKYLPEFSNVLVAVESDAEHKLLRKPKSPITIRQLLSHTSGLPFKSSLEEPTPDQFPLVARVRSYAMTPLESEPGSRYKYSNAGINTAARILEVVSGKPFEIFLDERGAYSTNTVVDRKDGLIFVWLVQHAGFKGEGAKSQDAFRAAASNTYLQLNGKKSP